MGRSGENGNYHSLSLKATRRFSQGFNVISSYTWAKSLDTTSGIRNQGFDTLYPQNSYCIACERGPSAFDVTHRMVTSVLYDLPVGKGKGLGIDNAVVNTMLGGWSLGGILTMQSGRFLRPVSRCSRQTVEGLHGPFGRRGGTRQKQWKPPCEATRKSSTH